MADDRHLQLVERLTDAFAEEIDRHDRTAAVPWPWWPDAAALIGHLGAIHGWASEVVRTGERVPDPEDRPAPEPAADWYRARRADLLDALRSHGPDRACWVFTGADRTVGFWRRRMVFETAKHLIDLRASGGGRREPPAELDGPAFADGIDELFSVFLQRSRRTLPRLPTPVRLVATDLNRAWTVTTTWEVSADATEDAAEIRASVGDLALLVWQRADPGADRNRFTMNGSLASIPAFRDAEIHP